MTTSASKKNTFIFTILFIYIFAFAVPSFISSGFDRKIFDLKGRYFEAEEKVALEEVSALETYFKINHHSNWYKKILPSFKHASAKTQHEFYNLKGNVMLDYGQIDESIQALEKSIVDDKADKAYYLRFELMCRLLHRGKHQEVYEALKVIQENYSFSSKSKTTAINKSITDFESTGNFDPELLCKTYYMSRGYK